MRRHAPNVYVLVTGTKLRETELAVHFKFHKVREGVLAAPMTCWIPLSQVSKRMTDPKVPGTDTMMVAEWILEKNGILEADLESSEEKNNGVKEAYEDYDDDIPF